jgi:hypothetical protein
MNKKTMIHVNQHKIRKREPKPLSVKTYNSNEEASTAAIVVNGVVVAKVVYRPHEPLSCGARVWIETRELVISGDDDILELGAEITATETPRVASAQ